MRPDRVKGGWSRLIPAAFIPFQPHAAHERLQDTRADTSTTRGEAVSYSDVVQDVTATESKTRCAFLIGSPRSGTSWLQALLGAHPDVVTPQELDLFSRYLPQLWDAFAYELSRTPQDRIVGLITALTEEEFEELLRRFVASVYERVLAMKPGAVLVLEKNPSYSLHVQLIDRLIPEARYLHLIRDGRDVTASLVAAGRSWGHRWAPAAVGEAARTWRAHVESARSAAAFGDRYLEVHYESLLDAGAIELLTLFRFLGLDADDAMCREIVDSYRFTTEAGEQPLAASIMFGGEALRRFGRVDEPSGFFRRGQAGRWSSTLTAREERICEDVCGELLLALGYKTSGTHPSGLRSAYARIRAETDRVARGSARRVGRRLQSWGSR